MKSRMDRYQENQSKTTSSRSRTEKNEELYQNLGNTMKYTSFSTEIPTIQLDAAKKNYRTREGYHQIKEYGNFFEEEKNASQKELEELNNLYALEENRIYDINSILEMAKKKRTLVDEREEKRKLKNDKYNILATMDEEELMAIKNRKKILKDEEEQEELQELIDTITSHTLREEIDAEQGGLLADLMATSAHDKVDPATQLEDEKSLELKGIEDKRLTKNIDASFYTKSMDLSDKDFELDDELEEDMKESKIGMIMKIIFLLILIAGVIVGAYFIIKSF